MSSSSSSSRIILYYRVPPEKDRFIPGDRFLRPLIRGMFRGKKIGGVERVFINLGRSLETMNIPYQVNLPFDQLQPSDRIIVIGSGKYSLEGYQAPNKIVAGIGLMTHPTEWPGLLEQYPVAKYLQHSEWAKNVYVPFYGDKVCDTWPSGIDTEKWVPAAAGQKTVDVLIYNKIRWEKDHYNQELREPLIRLLEQRGLSHREIVYGQYQEKDYVQLLKQCKSMVFLCEHESQGIACGEALAMDVPVLAWDQGFCLDPNRFKWGQPEIPATSVPFFDARCGITFKGAGDLETALNLFLERVDATTFRPREYILENLSLQKSAQRMLEILDEVYS
jgi:hypothetical protein